MILKEGVLYPLFFEDEDLIDSKECLEDVFSLKKGRQYRQFNKGQMIPLQIYLEIFNANKDETTDKEEVPVVEKESKINKSVDSDNKSNKSTKGKKVKK